MHTTPKMSDFLAKKLAITAQPPAEGDVPQPEKAKRNKQKDSHRSKTQAAKQKRKRGRFGRNKADPAKAKKRHTKP
jgi:hypothetical protein